MKEIANSIYKEIAAIHSLFKMIRQPLRHSPVKRSKRIKKAENVLIGIVKTWGVMRAYIESIDRLKECDEYGKKINGELIKIINRYANDSVRR